MSEGESANFFNLLASLGGMFGLFMGLSGVTLFELIEAHYVVFSNGFGVFRHALVVFKDYSREVITRKPSSDDEEDDLDAADFQIRYAKSNEVDNKKIILMR